MKVTTRMLVRRVDSVSDEAKQIDLVPVYSDDKSNPNYSYSKGIPAGQVQLLITNPDAWPLFEEWSSIDITFERTKEAT